MNVNGQRLLELCSYHNLCITNSFCGCKPQHKVSTMSLDDDWQQIKDVYHAASKETLGRKPEKSHNKRLSMETIALINKCNLLKKAKPNERNRTVYSQANKQVKKSMRKDDDKWASCIADRLQHAANVGNQRKVWHNIKVLSRKKQTSSSAVRDKNGEFITAQEKNLERRKEHIEELLNSSYGAASDVPPYKSC